jgi:hypothetical protein
LIEAPLLKQRELLQLVPMGLRRYLSGLHTILDACQGIWSLLFKMERVCGRAAPDAPERVYDQQRCTRGSSEKAYRLFQQRQERQQGGSQNNQRAKNRKREIL